MDYKYIKSHQRLILNVLSRQKELDAYPKASQQKDFIGQLNQLNSNGNATDVCVDQNMSVLVILEKIKEARLKFSQGSVKVL